MCTEVIVNGKWCATKGELREAIGMTPIADSGFEWLDECCLCSCDIETTAKVAGYTMKWYDSMEVEFTKMEPPK